AAAILFLSLPAVAADQDPRVQRFRSLTLRPDLWEAFRPAQPSTSEIWNNPQNEGTCGHILSYEPPKDLDKGIVRGESEAAQGNANDKIPQIKPMPVCPQDLRQL